MIRSLALTLGAAVVLAVAACAPAAAAPVWTFTPTEATKAPAVVTPAPAPTVIPPTAVPPTPTPTPVARPTAVPGTKDAPRIIKVTMGNFSYAPAAIVVQAGETIRFILSNPTTIPHEFVLGTAEEQEQHRMEMAGGMEHGHDESGADDHDMAEPSELELEAGATGELVWTFDEAGEQLMGCHIEGHWDAGMVGTIAVEG